MTFPSPDNPNTDTPTIPEMRRLRACVEAWPECQSGEYNPACCRFPKPCSCFALVSETPAELLVDPDPGVPTGDQPDPRLIDAIAQAIRVKNPQGAAQTAEVAAYVADGWHWAPGMPHRVPDSGVPTGDTRLSWTVDETFAATVTHAAHGSNLADQVAHRPGFCLACAEIYSAVNQALPAVRDAARVPALQATAEKLATLAFGLRDIHWDTNGYCNQCGGRYPCSTIRLVNELAQEAPDGE